MPGMLKLERTLTGLHGARGSAWIHDLPNLLDRVASRFELALDPPFPNLSYHYVAPARDRAGQPCVLKLGIPGREMESEIAALRHFDGRGAARLLGADLELGALLLERVQPGQPLHDLRDDNWDIDAISLATAEVMQRLWRPAERLDLGYLEAFPTVADWGRGFERLRRHYGGSTGPFPPEQVAIAERTYAEFAADAPSAVLLHGDLHPENILAARETERDARERATWLAIDPKGLVGEPAYEVGALLRNVPLTGLGDTEAGRRLDRCASTLAQALEMDRQRILRWGMAQAVLSAWWSVEDGEPEGGGGARRTAERLLALLDKSSKRF